MQCANSDDAQAGAYPSVLIGRRGRNGLESSSGTIPKNVDFVRLGTALRDDNVSGGFISNGRRPLAAYEDLSREILSAVVNVRIREIARLLGITLMVHHRRIDGPGGAACRRDPTFLRILEHGPKRH